MKDSDLKRQTFSGQPEYRYSNYRSQIGATNGGRPTNFEYQRSVSPILQKAYDQT